MQHNPEFHPLVFHHGLPISLNRLSVSEKGYGQKRNNPERSLFINFLLGSWPSCKLKGRFSILWKYRMKEFTDNVYSLFPILIGPWQGIVARIAELVADRTEMVECFTQGFLQSIFELMGLDLSAPDHSTLSRRRKNLTVHLPVKKTTKPRHLVIDSTGVKVYGEGEWKVRQHDWSKSRTWLKLHVCGDESSLEIISAFAMTNNVSDGEVLPDLINDVSGPISQVSADMGKR